MLSIGSVGSFASIGSVGSFASVFSLGSSRGVGAVLSHRATGSLLSNGVDGRVLSRQSEDARRDRPIIGHLPSGTAMVLGTVSLAAALGHIWFWRRRSRVRD